MADLPVRFEERMKVLLGEEYPAFAASYDKERVQGLRFNSLKFPDRIPLEAGKTGKRGKTERAKKSVRPRRSVRPRQTVRQKQTVRSKRSVRPK